MIEKLTAEQEALIPVYREKWRKIGLSTEAINRQKAEESVKALYANFTNKEPKLLFFDSPYAALKIILTKFKKQVKKQQKIDYEQHPWNKLVSEIQEQLWLQLVKNDKGEPLGYLKRQLESKLEPQLWYELLDKLWIELKKQMNKKIKWQFPICILPQLAACGWSLFDFCIAVLNCDCSQVKWSVLQSIVENCGWIFPFEEMCFVCDRPRILSFDSQNLLHAEGSPAIQFADGFSVYCYHGVLLPEQYGKVHPNEWRSQWLLEEQNAELKRVLIQRIGYDRICRELQAIELDNWQEYTLLKINADVDEEPMYLLKMTCPSTGHIHALRVPPDMESAREAIRWVNWGLDPEEFSVQT